MKKILLCSLLLLVSHLLVAGNLNELKARQKALGFWGETAPVKLAVKAQGDHPAYYIYNVERQQKGFVIVAGEDQEVLGYSDSGAYDEADVPPALLFWLQCYEEQVEHIRDGRAEVFRAPVEHTAIAPLIKTKWAQRGPYNLNNPKSGVTGLTFPCTGCTATAMAQIMKYWSADFQVSAVPAYSYQYEYNSSTYTINVDGLPATTFDYGIIRDTYASDETDEGAREVAKLMAYCGRAAKMTYKSGSSSATTTGSVFAQYFGYNPGYSDEYATSYTAATWDAMVYGELQSGRPVLMSGHKQSGGGHAFIVDGHKDGLYHFNWGWGGSYDGYYKLTEANPKGGGDGAGTGADGYSFSQKIIYHLQPEAMEPEDKLLTVTQLSADATSYTRTGSSENFTVSVTNTVRNYTGGSQYFQMAVGAYRDGDLASISQYTYGTPSAGSYYPDRTKNISFGSGVTNGVYYIKAICRTSTSGSWQEDKGSGVYYIKATVDGNTLTIQNPQAVLNVGSVVFEGYQKQGLTLTVKPTVTNIGTSAKTAIYLFADGTLETGTGVHLDEGESDDVPLYFTPSQAKTYQLTICGDEGGTQVLWSGQVTIVERAEPSLTASVLSVANSSSNTIKGTTFKPTLRVRNNATTAYNDLISFKLCKKASASATSGTVMQTKAVEVDIPAGSTINVEVAFDDLDIGGYYFINSYVYKPSTNQDVLLRGTGTYNIVADPTGIGVVTAKTPVRPAHDVVYDLRGRRISQGERPLSKGIYIKNGKKFVVR